MTTTDREVMVRGANHGNGQAPVWETLGRGVSRMFAGTRQPLAHMDGQVRSLASLQRPRIHHAIASLPDRGPARSAVLSVRLIISCGTPGIRSSVASNSQRPATGVRAGERIAPYEDAVVSLAVREPASSWNPVCRWGDGPPVRGIMSYRKSPNRSVVRRPGATKVTRLAAPG
jgi:hypothetical protein